MSDLFKRAKDFFNQIPEAPTNPTPQKAVEKFKVADLFEDESENQKDTKENQLDEKLRQAYFWISNTAIISPYYDVEYPGEDDKSFFFGDSNVEVTLPSDQSYSSFVLIPLLNLVIRGKCLIVGGPGRGKTATSILLGLLAGYSKKDIMRAIQHGQPQMTISDLLGHPLPADMVKAES